MRPRHINLDNTVFVIVSFEGPDPYSMAGGLGARVTHLSETLASLGFPIHLFFVGNPHKRGVEVRREGKLILHRWCQWISQYYPDGVYHGEADKLRDFNESLPPFLLEQIAKPAIEEGKILAILGEEWHTAEVMCRISDLLYYNGLRHKAVLFWNANNTISFDQIDWERLSFTSTITTVSRYMRQIMKGMGLNPLVIPNGIPHLLVNRVDVKSAMRLRRALPSDLILSKVARWDPAKAWMESMEAVARLKGMGLKISFLVRGGVEPYGGEVLACARYLGLTVQDAQTEGESSGDFLRAIRRASSADIIDIRFPIPQGFLRTIYRASDVVLANSIHEPFGLVGLEAMAAGAIPILGGTGEDYAIPFRNCFITETGNPEEVADHILYLYHHPEKRAVMRRNARRMARAFTWEQVVGGLIGRLEHQASTQGIMMEYPMNMR